MEHAERVALGLAAGALVLSGCGRWPVEALPKARAQREDATLAEMMCIFGFGLRPGQMEAAGTPQEWFENQLRAEEPSPVSYQAALHRLDILRLDPVTLMDLPVRVIESQLQQAAILRAAMNPNQLFERMVDFWIDHFNVYAKKGEGAFWLTASNESVIRRHALGKFRDLLQGVASSPAMLEYLDNSTNRSGNVNENFARELLELHTLGVNGGYSQRDVQELARCLSGWRVEDRFLRARGTFRFDESRHTKGVFTILEKKFSQAGQQSGVAAIDMLADHPSTAKHLALKMLKYFSREATSSEVNKVAEVFLDSGGDIKSTVREVARCPIHTPRVRRPLEYMVACLRVTGATTDAGPALVKHLNQMGQGTHQWPMPDGYPLEDRAWLSGLLTRWNFAFALVEGRIPGTRMHPELELQPRSRYLWGTERHISPHWAAALAAPDFQRSYA